ncbi:nitrous oxide reductase accessory protein NosL [Salinimicrobium oceani]|uniref:Copper chaperone NosL n=1 Tax=Salinimicrobium oceani TaxID=2722702 RepID=A0ABX1CYA7_9FLAO|nr:nitrous oxide reductase accessory protein NosL [Salinimicrobium oceani]NJW53245.1 hypothetical protein [Salinimicrobium oceani]
MMKKLLYLLIIFLVQSCSKETRPIAYGKDACDFCQMTIVDRAYAAQTVSEKGKQSKYDAIECMIHDLENSTVTMAVQRVADFSDPGKMISVDKAVFIINDSINSPMGAKLAAVNRKTYVATTKSADTFSWNDLLEHLLASDSIIQ